MKQTKYDVLTKTTGNKEVVRLTVKNDGTEKEMKAGYIASFIIRALILEDKDVYLSYISTAKTKLAQMQEKKERVLILMNRMLNDSLETICGGFDKVPPKYVGKKLMVLASLPYNKKVDISQVGENNSYVKLNGFESVKPTATFVRFYLVDISEVKEN